jgi:hypothetical protein
VHLTTYHGVFAPAASYRDRVVPSLPEENHDDASCTKVDPTPERPKRKRYSWAELMKRVLEVDVLICEHCDGTRTLLAFLTEPRTVRRILEHLGLPQIHHRSHRRTPPPELRRLRSVVPRR